MKRLALSLLLVCVLAFATIYALNSHDQVLKPEVATALNMSPTLTDRQKAAYFYALGVHSEATQEFEQAGRDLYEQFRNLKTREQANFWNQKVARRAPWDEQFLGCIPEYRVCTAAFALRYSEIKAELTRGPQTMDQYIALMHYRATADLFEGSKKVPFTRIWLMSARMHRKLLLQVSFWLVEGKRTEAFKLIEDTNLYMQSLLKNGSLFEVSTAAQILADNVEFLTAEKQRLPKTKFAKSLSESFIPPSSDEIFKATVARELKTMKFLSENFSESRDGPILRPLARKFLPMSLLLLPNETYNDFWLRNQTPPGAEEASTRLHNPLGKALLDMTNLKLAQRRLKIEAHLQQARTFAEAN